MKTPASAAEKEQSQPDAYQPVQHADVPAPPTNGVVEEKVFHTPQDEFRVDL